MDCCNLVSVSHPLDSDLPGGSAVRCGDRREIRYDVYCRAGRAAGARRPVRQPEGLLQRGWVKGEGGEKGTTTLSRRHTNTVALSGRYAYLSFVYLLTRYQPPSQATRTISEPVSLSNITFVPVSEALSFSFIYCFISPPNVANSDVTTLLIANSE